MMHTIIFAILVSLWISWMIRIVERRDKEEDKRREEQLRRILREMEDEKYEK